MARGEAIPPMARKAATSAEKRMLNVMTVWRLSASETRCLIKEGKGLQIWSLKLSSCERVGWRCKLEEVRSPRIDQRRIGFEGVSIRWWSWVLEVNQAATRVKMLYKKSLGLGLYILPRKTAFRSAQGCSTKALLLTWLTTANFSRSLAACIYTGALIFLYVWTGVKGRIGRTLFTSKSIVQPASNLLSSDSLVNALRLIGDSGLNLEAGQRDLGSFYCTMRRETQRESVWSAKSRTRHRSHVGRPIELGWNSYSKSHRRTHNSRECVPNAFLHFSAYSQSHSAVPNVRNGREARSDFYL